jgi:hypothetical protein
MKRWGVLLLALIAMCLVSETPLAYATPPDQTWLEGIYDDDDGDDVVVSLSWGAWLVYLAPLTGVTPRFVAVPFALPGTARLLPTPARPEFLSRAPPAVA